MPDQVHSLAREVVLEVMVPEAVAARATLVEAKQFATNLAMTILQSCADLIDFQTADGLDARTAEAA